jgi:hypothetical protein
MAGEVDESDFDIHIFFNLDAMDEEAAVEAQLKAAAAVATAQPQLQDPATLVQPQTVPIAQVFPHVQAAASDYVLHYSQVLAPPPIQHQQTMGESSAYGFDDQMMTETHHPDRQEMHVQQQRQHPLAPVQRQQMLVESSSASGFDHQMMRPAPIANVQTNIQGAPSDQVSTTATYESLHQY